MAKNAQGEDVQDVVDPNKSAADVEAGKDKVDDKDKNFAALRTKIESLEKENEELKKGKAPIEDDKRDLNTGKDDEEDESEDDEDDTPDPIKVVFDRDVREATNLWNKKNKVTADEWKQIKAKVSLTGDETVSEIQDKIDEAYASLPEVRKKRDQELIDKGRKQAMSEHTDEELDMGGGGEGYGESRGSEPVLNPKEKKFLNNFGVSKEDQKGIDKSQNTSSWKTGKSATRKAFQP